MIFNTPLDFHIDNLKLPVTTISNQDKKIAFIRFDEDGALESSSKFMKTCQKMNITFQTTSGDASSLNEKAKYQIIHWIITQGLFY